MDLYTAAVYNEGVRESEIRWGMDGRDGGFKTNRPPPGDPCPAKLIKRPCPVIKPCLILRTFKADRARARRQGMLRELSVRHGICSLLAWLRRPMKLP